MATFLQWHKNRTLKPVAWICGAEPALVREVLAAYRADCPADCRVDVLAGDVPDSGIWDLLLADPLPGDPRLAVVHGADKMVEAGPLPALLSAATADGPRAVFISGEDDFTRADGELASHLAAVKSSQHGQMIRCCAPSRTDDQVALVATWWPGASLPFALDVLQRCGSDLSAAWSACDKARRAKLPPDAKSAACACARPPGAEFADRLIAGDKAGAMACARAAGRGETGAGLGLLASRLRVLSAVNEAQRAGATPRELPTRIRWANRFVLRMLGPHAWAYGPDRVARLREVLAMAESAWRSGAQAAVAESVVALW